VKTSNPIKFSSFGESKCRLLLNPCARWCWWDSVAFFISKWDRPGPRPSPRRQWVWAGRNVAQRYVYDVPVPLPRWSTPSRRCRILGWVGVDAMVGHNKMSGRWEEPAASRWSDADVRC
jgi:hypothetical protein